MLKTTIEALGSSGEGIGTLEDGLKVFVDGALPGEEVEIALVQRKKTYAKGKLLRVLTPSKMRTTPICPLFGTCGGCQIMHLNYETQLEVKRQRIIDAFERIGEISNPQVEPCTPSPKPLHYRNKIQLPVSAGKIGLYRKNSHEVIDVKKCFIHCEQGEELYTWIRTHLQVPVRHILIRSAVFNQETVVTFVTDGSKSLKTFAQEIQQRFPQVVGVVENINRSTTNTVLGKTFRTLIGRSHIFEKIGGKTFKIAVPSFFQVNSWQAGSLFQKAIELASIQPNETVLDAFTGVGTLALFAADRAKHVTGIECIPEAIADAKENAKLNGITNCSFSVGHAHAQTADITLLNPPRKGCDPQLLSAIGSKKIVYISCDPATLARDLRLLKGYQIEKIVPFDLFPQTTHVETVVSLKR